MVGFHGSRSTAPLAGFRLHQLPALQSALNGPTGPLAYLRLQTGLLLHRHPYLREPPALPVEGQQDRTFLAVETVLVHEYRRIGTSRKVDRLRSPSRMRL